MKEQNFCKVFCTWEFSKPSKMSTTNITVIPYLRIYCNEEIRNPDSSLYTKTYITGLFIMATI